jgi:glycosyltransferase involved in cell wall biosynthesis
MSDASPISDLTIGGRLDYKEVVRFNFIGAYDPAYPRSAVFRKGLARIGADVVECRTGAHFKFWARYPLLFLDAAKRGLLRTGADSRSGCFFVPEFCAKDVPLAKLLSVLTARPVIFDPLAARYETKIVDWGWRREDTPAAWWNFRIDAAAFRLANLILADTAAHKTYYCATYGLDPAKVEVLPLGYDDDIFRPSLPDSEQNESGPPGSFPRGKPNDRAISSPYRQQAESSPRDSRDARPRKEGEILSRGASVGFQVLFFGSFLPLHGADVVVEAARLVAAADPSIRFRFIGEGRTFPEVRAAAAAAGLTNVEFSGRLPLRELPAAIASSDLCLGIFGRTEKARRVVPHKIYQAMGMGRTVVTARTPAIEEFFTSGKNIILCDEPYAESLARAVLDLARDAALRDRLARSGLDLVRREFTPEAVARRLAKIVTDRFGIARPPRI